MNLLKLFDVYAWKEARNVLINNDDSFVRTIAFVISEFVFP